MKTFVSSQLKNIFFVGVIPWQKNQFVKNLSVPSALFLQRFKNFLPPNFFSKFICKSTSFVLGCCDNFENKRKTKNLLYFVDKKMGAQKYVHLLRKNINIWLGHSTLQVPFISDNTYFTFKYYFSLILLLHTKNKLNHE